MPSRRLDRSGSLTNPIERPKSSAASRLLARAVECDFDAFFGENTNRRTCRKRRWFERHGEIVAEATKAWFDPMRDKLKRSRFFERIAIAVATRLGTKQIRVSPVQPHEFGMRSRLHHVAIVDRHDPVDAKRR